MALTDNIVAYWKLDESSGNAADSVASETLTNTNTVTYATAKINNGATLTAASSMQLAGSDNAALEAAEFSVSLWVKCGSQGTGYLGWLTKEATSIAGWDVGVIGSDGGADAQKPFLQVQDSGGTNYQVKSLRGVTVTDNAWHHIVWTWSTTGQTPLAYFDGTLATQTNVASSGTVGSFASNEVVRIGKGFAGAYYNGSIDEVGYWDRVITSGEVTSLYNGGAGLQYPFRTAKILVVAGGAGSGYSAGGGGGAGGVQYDAAHTITAGTYTITIGAGGAGGDTADEKGASGGNSSIVQGTGTTATITATGGGGGGAAATTAIDGVTGGSGGGAAPNGSGAGNPGATDGTNTFGNGGGEDAAATYAAGGGGGAGAIGSAGTGGGGGDGGIGVADADVGNLLTLVTAPDTDHIAGGGGGGTALNLTAGAGGNGGGGNGGASADAAGSNGIINTGGGGGGGRNDTVATNGGNGGTGIFILAVPTSDFTITCTGTGGGVDYTTGTGSGLNWIKVLSTQTVTLTEIGATSIKAINGIVVASVSKFNGLAIGSIKNINGLA